MAAGCYFAMGNQVGVMLHVTCHVSRVTRQVRDNIVLAMSGGWEKVTVEIMLLLHLVTAYPIITNPPAQFFEQVFDIPSSEHQKMSV